MLLRLLILSCLLFHFAAVAGAQDASRIAERYKQMLEKNPVEGTALDRLWKTAQDAATTGALLDEYKAAGDKFAGAMIYGHLLRKAGRIDDARASYERAALLDDKSALPHLALSHLFFEQQKPPEVAAELEKAAALLPPDDPAMPDVLLQLGDAWLAANDPAKAADAWERTVARDSSNLALRQRLAENYEKNALSEKAIAHYETIEAHGDPQQRAQALKALARIHQARGDQDSAIGCLEKALTLTAPGNWMRGELQAQLIRLHQRYHRTAELEQRWKKAVEENPRDLGGYLQLIDLYERLPDREQERVWLEKVTNRLPKNAEYKIKLARLLVQLGQLDRAGASFDELLNEQPTNADLVFARAEIDIQREMPQPAKLRIEALLQATRNDEMLLARALEFYRRNRMFDLLEQHLKAGATTDEGVLALAGFYFSQRRRDEADKALDSLVRKSDPPEKRAAAFAKIAGARKEQSQPGQAIEAMQKAVASQPGSADYRLALSDLLAASNRPDDALKEAEAAFRVSADDGARLAADQKIFQLFQARSTEKAPAPRAPGIDLKRPIELLSIVPRPRGSHRPEGSPLQKYIAALAGEAAEKPTLSGFLRVARWQMWNRNAKAALDFCRRALELDPSSIPARELAVKAASANGQKQEAIAQLRELIAIDPGKKQAWLKQIGQIELESGRINQALEIFSDIEKANPGDVEVLRDLAAAQQQAGLAAEALATWQRAYESSRGPKRKEIAQSVLRALERLGQHPAAAEFMLKAVDEQSEEDAKRNLLQDTLAYCTRHDLLGWLQTQFEQRSQQHPDDYFIAMALAKTLKANGHARESFTVLSEAAFSAPIEADALRELVREAEEIGNLDAAIRHQQRLVQLAPQTDSAGLEKLASLQESSLDIDGAMKSWDKIAQLFPREPTVLIHAVEFFETWDFPDRAKELLRKIRVLDAGNLRALMTLAKLTEASGDHAEAISCCEQALQNSTPEKRGDAFSFPDLQAPLPTRIPPSHLVRLRLRTLSAATRNRAPSRIERAASGERELRLEAIRRNSTVLKSTGDEAALRAWLARWDASAPSSEALWAFYFSDAHDLALQELAAMMRSAPADPQVRQAFVWIALQLGEYGKIHDWILEKNRTPAEREMLVLALEQWLSLNRGDVDRRLMSELFDGRFDISYLLWQAAAQFAAHNHFEEAVKLGERVFANSKTQRAAYGVELAHWQIILGDAAGARRILRDVISTTADSFDSPVYEAMREYYFLLPEDERTPFVEAWMHSGDRAPLHDAISRTLLHGLEGNEPLARSELARLLDLRAIAFRSADNAGDSAAYRHWTFVLTAGLQLQAWKLDALAMFFWERATGDRAAISLQDEQAGAVAREVRMRLLAAKVTRGPIAEIDFLLDDFMRTSGPDALATVASVLDSSGFHAQSMRVFLRLWKRDPKNQQALRNVMNSARAAGDLETAQSVAAEAIGSELSPQANPNVFREMVLELAQIFERKSEHRAARRVLEQASLLMPKDVALLERFASFHQENAELIPAEKALRQLREADPDNDSRLLPLASVLDAQGRTAAAIELLEKTKNAHTLEIDGQLAELYLKAGQLDKIPAQAERLLRGGDFNRVGTIAKRLAENGSKREALRLLQGALSKCKDARMSFRLQTRLVETLSANEDAGLRDKALKRLRVMADQENLAAYFDVRSRVGNARDGWKAISDEWDGGAGSLAAGAKLIAHYIHSKDEEALSETVGECLESPEFEPQLFQTAIQQLTESHHYDFALKLIEASCQRTPLVEAYFFKRARVLFLLDRKPEAVELLDALCLRYVFNDEIAGRIAETFVELGDVADARRIFELATKRDPGAVRYKVYLSFARLLAKQRELPAAKRVLLAAFRNPANREVGSLVDFYADAGKLDRFENEVGEFGLPSDLLRTARAALFVCYANAGDAVAALAIVQRHPDLVALEPGVRSGLRAIADRTGQFASAVALCETALAQSADEHPELAIDLAHVYFDWARQDTNASNTDSELIHLKRANELAPAEFDIAEALVKLLVEKNERPRAIEVLTRLIEITAHPADAEKARKLLATIRA